MTFSRRTMMGGLAALGAVAAGCAENSTGTGSTTAPGGSAAPGGGASGPIKLGVVVDATGAGASLGGQQKQVSDLWAEKLAKESIGGRKIELVFRDNRSDPGEAAKVTNELLATEKVDMVLGCTRTGTSLAMVPICAKAEVPMISFSANKAIVEKDGKQLPYIFKTAQNDDVVMERLVEVMTKNGHKKIALLRDASAYGEGVKELLEAKGKSAGITTTATTKFDTTATDFTSQIVEARDSKPDALLIWGIPPAAATCNKQAAGLAKGLPIYQSHGVANADLLKLGGPEINGTNVIAGRLVVADQIPSSDKQKEALNTFISEFKGKYGVEPNAFAGHAHDAFVLALAALKKVGSADKKKIRDYLETAEVIGISGPFKMSADDHSGLKKDALVEMKIENGKFKYVSGAG